MTVQNTTSKAGPYAGAGTKGPFAVGFRFLEETHLQVIRTDLQGLYEILTLNTDYTVAGVDNEAGGSVTLTENLPVGYKLTILRNVPATQVTDYVDGDSFPAESHERALDKLTMITQQLREQVDRAAKLPVTSTADSQTLTNNITRLAASADGIDTVAANIAAVDVAAENINAIIDAPTQAQAAADSAQAADESAQDAANTYTDFDNRYLGSKPSDPTTDNQGNPLVAGALYWSTATDAMRVYSGTAWDDVAKGVSFPYQVLSGDGVETEFTLDSAPGSLGSLEVFIAGIRQVPITDYTLTGAALTFVTAPPSGTNNIFARWLTTQAVSVPSDGSIAVSALKEDFVLPIDKGGTGSTKGAGRLFELAPHNGPIEGIDEGFIPAFGQTWFADTYPDAAAGLEAGKQFMVSELLWQSGVTGNPDAYKGCWSSGGTDGSGRRWYRAPKLNADTSYRAPFLRGAQIGVDAGVVTLDQFQGFHIGNGDGKLGKFDLAVSSGGTPVGGMRTGTTDYARPISNGVNGTPRMGDETHPRYHGVIMCIRMFGAVSNAGSIDAAQLATDLGVANAKIAALENALSSSLSTKELLWSGSASSGSITLSKAVSNGQKLAVVFTVSSVRHASLPSTFFSSDANWPATCSFVAAMPAYVGGTLTISGTSATVAVSSGAITAVYALKG